MRDRTLGGTQDERDEAYGTERERYRDDATGSSDPIEQDRFGDGDTAATSAAYDRPLSARSFDENAADNRLADDTYRRESTPELAGSTGASTEHVPLFKSDDSDQLRARWKEIQTKFVDEPRQSVEEADELVAQVTDQLTSAFTRNRNELERQWSAGDDVSTENLRQTLQQYRSFFERLLSM